MDLKSLARLLPDVPPSRGDGDITLTLNRDKERHRYDPRCHLWTGRGGWICSLVWDAGVVWHNCSTILFCRLSLFLFFAPKRLSPPVVVAVPRFLPSVLFPGF